MNKEIDYDKEIESTYTERHKRYYQKNRELIQEAKLNRARLNSDSVLEMPTTEISENTPNDRHKNVTTQKEEIDKINSMIDSSQLGKQDESDIDKRHEDLNAKLYDSCKDLPSDESYVREKTPETHTFEAHTKVSEDEIEEDQVKDPRFSNDQIDLFKSLGITQDELRYDKHKNLGLLQSPHEESHEGFSGKDLADEMKTHQGYHQPEVKKTHSSFALRTQQDEDMNENPHTNKEENPDIGKESSLDKKMKEKYNQR